MMHGSWSPAHVARAGRFAIWGAGRRIYRPLRKVGKTMPDNMDTARLLTALRGVPAPAGGDIVAAGLIDAMSAKDGIVQLALLTDRAQAPAMEKVRLEAERALRRIPGILNASVVLTAHKAEAPAPHGADREKFLAHVPTVIAVASGKGGVGKSTVAVNLAVALAQAGRRVGLIDADIYGPSLPRMLGRQGKPEVVDKMMQPVEAFGMRCMSIGFLVPEEQAMIWRGPMIMGALNQMLGQTDWGTLDVMVVDLPPGTGDAQLTLSQRVAVSGAVIVSTPQDIALIDARRGVAMFEKLGVPILGVIENMSFFCCPACGQRTEIFGHGGARAEAAKLGVQFLGEIPLLAAVRESGDGGVPVVIGMPESEAAAAFRDMAKKIWTAAHRAPSATST
jgi:ATP-binding protein involved in chromosome partitioning